MSVEFFDYKGQIAYRETPLIMDKEYADKLGKLMKNDERRAGNGWSKERTMRYAGSIPREIYFNKIQETKDKNYWEANNGKNMKLWFNDNPYFRVGEKFIKGGK